MYEEFATKFLLNIELTKSKKIIKKLWRYYREYKCLKRNVNNFLSYTDMDEIDKKLLIMEALNRLENAIEIKNKNSKYK